MSQSRVLSKRKKKLRQQESCWNPALGNGLRPSIPVRGVGLGEMPISRHPSSFSIMRPGGTALPKIPSPQYLIDASGRAYGSIDPLPTYVPPLALSSDFPELSNPFSILYGLHHKDAKKQKRKERCARSSTLRRKAQKIVRLLAVDQSLESRPEAKIPKDITCGSLRVVVRSMYAQELTLIQELSIKTSAKAEAQPCPFCRSKLKEKMETYEKDRLKIQSVDDDHLRVFRRAFIKNVPDRWNTRKSPYVPNGHSALDMPRSRGGNWVTSSFSEDCEVKSVFSSGKPRIVTLYSEHNVRVLTPLHHSLYAFLKGRNWLLVGSPTDERLAYLQSGCEGDEWLSFDYIGATDNIKVAYVNAAIEILIDKGEGLSEDEVRCLRVVSGLTVGDGACAESGMPMGSPMSFPLLCLINKTIVDMALTDLLLEGKVGFNEWTRHRCLINGDDLLTRSTSSGCLFDAVARNGAQVGMKTNREKTMRDRKYGEINSTLFDECKKKKKTNVSALWMGPDVPDVIGFANESCVSDSGFRMVMSNNASRLARQKIKTCVQLPFSRMKIMVSKRRLRAALTSRPSSKAPEDINLFGVEPLPEGFSLSRDEINEAVSARVQRLKECESWRPLFANARKNKEIRASISAIPSEVKRPLRGFYSILRPKKPKREDTVLSCLARFWENKRKEELLAGECCSRFSDRGPVLDEPRIQWLASVAREFKQKKQRQQDQIASAFTFLPFHDGFEGYWCSPFWGGFVSLSDL